MSINDISGCMFSGKSTFLIELAKKLENDGKKFIVIKHIFDTRYQDSNAIWIISHSGIKYPAKGYNRLSDIPKKDLNVEYILIEEAQFFPDLYMFCKAYKELGIHIYVFGLNENSEKEPFGEMPKIKKIADTTRNLFAKCSCGQHAKHTYRNEQILPKELQGREIIIGGSEIYEPVCTNCYDLKKNNSIVNA